MYNKCMIKVLTCRHACMFSNSCLTYIDLWSADMPTCWCADMLMCLQPPPLFFFNIYRPLKCWHADMLTCRHASRYLIICCTFLHPPSANILTWWRADMPAASPTLVLHYIDLWSADMPTCWQVPDHLMYISASSKCRPADTILHPFITFLYF